MPQYISTTVAAHVRPIGSTDDFSRRTFDVEVDVDFDSTDTGRLTEASRQIEGQGLEIRDIEFLQQL